MDDNDDYSRSNFLGPAVEPPTSDAIHQRPPRFPGLKSYATMSGLLVLAAATALAQHSYYNHLNHQEINRVALPQSWVTRIGNTLAFLFKTCLSAEACVAFCQGFWHVVRRKAIRLGGLDAMFGVLYDPRNFANSDLLLRAKTLFVLAVISWIFPITAILSPGALTGYIFHAQDLVLIVVIPLPMSILVNAQVPVLGPMDADVGFIETGTGESYLGLTQQLTQVAIRVLTGGELITWQSPCTSNCSYNVSFSGPAYSCQSVASVPSFLTSTVQDYTWIPYLAGEDWTGDLASQGLWIVRGWPSEYNVTQCRVFEATYTTTVHYFENIQTVNTSIVYQDQIPGSIQNYTETEVYGQIKSSWTLLNMFSISESVTRMLAGIVEVSSVYGGYDFNSTLIGVSNLATFSPFNATFPDNFETLLEELLINTTLSLNYFLTKPTISQNDDYNMTSPVIQTLVRTTQLSYPPAYSYSAITLWAIYGPALIVGFLVLCAGCYMLADNGVDSDMSFTQVLVTTRNETLDRRCEGAWMGGEYLTKSLRDTKLKYGQLGGLTAEDDEDGKIGSHPGFGLENEVSNLK